MPNGDRPHFRIRDELVQDDLVTRTGYAATYPRPDYGAHGRTLVRRAQEFRQAAAHTLDLPLSESLFVQVRTPEQVPIRQEKTRLRNVGLEVVSYSKRDPSAGTARVAKAQFDQFEGRLLDYAVRPSHPGRSYLSILEDITEVPPEDKIDEQLMDLPAEQELDCIVYIQATLTPPEQRAILGQIGTYVAENQGLLIDRHQFSSGLATALVRVRRRHLDGLGRSFNTVREIRPNRLFFVEDATPIAAIPSPLPVATPRSTTTVAVVDSGIRAASPALASIVRGVLPQLPPTAVAPDFAHGTFVASRVAYGDDLESQIQRGQLTPQCWLYDVQVFGRTGAGSFAPTDEHRLAAALDTALPMLPREARVVNLSLGTDTPINDHEYSLVASTIDHLARVQNLLVVTTAGNVRDLGLVSQYPNSVADPRCRIDPPGESLLALTVGSIAHYGDASTLSGARELSPFSRVGPGADGGRKPEVVAHGGNYARPARPLSRYAVQGIFNDGRQLAWDNGTSFAAPLVAASAAQLFHAYPNAEANLVKALLCHFTTPAVAPAIIADPCRCVGFGEPNLTAALGSIGASATFLYTGGIRADRYLFVPFLVPNSLAPGRPGSRLAIRCTVVFDPPVDPNNPQEYSKARIAVALRKPAQVGHAEVQLAGAMSSYYQWNPVIQFAKPFSRQYAPGNWEIRLRLFTRDLPDGFEQRFALVIEVQDLLGGIDVWSDVRNEAGDNYVPVVLNVAA